MTEGGACTVDKAILEGPRMARQMVLEMMGDQNIHSITQVRDTLGGATQDLLACDPTFLIELAFISGGMVDSVSEQLQAKILAAMPSPEMNRSELIAIRAMESLQSSMLYRWAPPTAKSSLDVCLDVVRKLAERKSPPQHLENSTAFYRSFHAQLQYFLHEEIAGSASQPSQHIYGREALLRRLPKLEEKNQRGETSIGDVESMLAWHHLLKDHEVERLTKILKQLVTAGSRAGQHDSRAKKAKKESKMPEDDIDQFFS